MALPTSINWDDVHENQGGVTNLEPGGYVVKVIGIQDITDNTGSYLNVDFDIAEGPFTGYYARLFERWPERWKGHIRLYYSYTVKRTGEVRVDYGRVKAFKSALEKSNSGLRIPQFTPNMLQLICNNHLLLGVLMGYDTKEHRYLNAYQVRSADVIRSGDYEIPAEWRIHNDGKAASAYGGGSYGNLSGASSTPDEDDGDLPF